MALAQKPVGDKHSLQSHYCFVYLLKQDYNDNSPAGQ